MHAGGDIWTSRENWRNPLVWSAALHLALFGGAIVYGAILGGSGEGWGSSTAGGGAMSATLVSSVPLPRAAVDTENILANESKGLTQTLPQPKEAAPEPEAVPIPEKDTRKRPQAPKQAKASVQPPKRPVEAPEPSNVVPFGKGGPVSGPYGSFTTANAEGGFGFSGSGGDFGSRFGWYVDGVRRKVSENWLKYEVDPNIRDAQRVFITFDITRAGQPVNVQLSQTSGVPSLDISAVRAIQRIDTFGPLPNDYPGGRVSVEFWFDYRR